MQHEIPEHRRSFEQRSGDTHVIGEDGVAHNVDQEARDTAAALAAPAPGEEHSFDHDSSGGAGGDSSADKVLASEAGVTLTDIGGGYYTISAPGTEAPARLRGRTAADQRYAELLALAKAAAADAAPALDPPAA